MALTFTEAAARRAEAPAPHRARADAPGAGLPAGRRDPAPRRAAEARGGAHRHDPRVLRRAAARAADRGRRRSALPGRARRRRGRALRARVRALVRAAARAIRARGAAHPATPHAHGRPRALLEGAARELVEWRDFTAPWTRRPFDRDREIDEIVADLAALGPEALPATDRDVLGRSLHDVASFVEHVARREQLRGRDYDGLEAELVELCRAEALALEGLGARERRRAEGAARPARRREGGGSTRSCATPAPSSRRCSATSSGRSSTSTSG